MAGGRDLELDNGQPAVMPWNGRLWRDSSGLLSSFPRIEEPVELLPVYLAFFLHYLAGWSPFGACRGCLPLCRSQLLPSAVPPEAAAGFFNLGILAISMRLRMFPRRMWRRPPQSVFLVYKFFISLFIFEISHNCIFKAVERTLYEGLPAACDAVAQGSSYLDLQWLMDAACGVLDSDWAPWLMMQAMFIAFLVYALSAARLNTLGQFSNHPLLALTAAAAVLYKARTGPHCEHHAWG